MLRKKRVGADVTFVFMTDGSKSHKDWVSETKLKQMRRREGIAAARVLGLDSRDIICLGFEETRLPHHREQAIERVVEILRDLQPGQLFVPYRGEAPADHTATFEIVAAAVGRWGHPVTVYEYPIWFWDQWPWVRKPGPKRMLSRGSIRTGARLRPRHESTPWRSLRSVP